MSTKRKLALPKLKMPRAAVISLSILPAVLTAIFYALRSNESAMEWVSSAISAPVRGFMGMLSSIYPFSLMEVLCTAAVIWLIFYIVRTVIVTVKAQPKLAVLSKRVLTIIVLALYAWSLHCWLWNSGYFAPGFAEKNGFSGSGVSVDDLTAVTNLFADKANEYAPLVKRDAEGHFIEERRDYTAASVDIYDNLSAQYPSLSGRLYEPKTMLYSWFMSRMGYTGVYFAITGESNINVREPGFYLPATIAHELAHQHGVFAEDEANFVSITACVTSGHMVYAYSGYLSGLTHLLNALYAADYDAWSKINDRLCPEIKRDWQDNREYWQSQKTVTTGISFVDKILTSVNQALSDTVNTAYDGYLKSQHQVLGIKSYGACVDLLVEHFK